MRGDRSGRGQPLLPRRSLAGPEPAAAEQFATREPSGPLGTAGTLRNYRCHGRLLRSPAHAAAPGCCPLVRQVDVQGFKFLYELLAVSRGRLK